MTEITLGLIIMAMMAFIYLRDKDHDKQINQLIKGIIAKNPQDMVNLTLADKTKIKMEEKPPLGPTPDEFAQLGSADAELFDKMIAATTTDGGQSAWESPNESDTER